MNAAALALCLFTLGQPKDDTRILEKVHDEARVFAKAFKDDDHAKLADLTFAPWLDKFGSRTRALLAWQKQTSQYRYQGLKIEGYDVAPPINFVKAGKEWV